MLREKVRYARFEMRLPMVRRADGLNRDDCCVGSRHERRQLERVDAEGLFHDFADLARDRAHEHARHARLHELLLGQVGPLQRPEIGVLSCRDVAEQQRRDLDRRQRRIRHEHRPQPLHRARGAQRDAIGLPRHAHLRFGGDVEHRLDAHGIREVDRAAGHEIAPAFEDELAARDLGAAEDDRTLVGAAERADRRSRRSSRRCFRCAAFPGAMTRTSRRTGRTLLARRRARRDDRRAAAEPPPPKSNRFPLVSNLVVQTAFCTVTVPASTGAVTRPVSDKIGVDFRTHAFGIPQAHAAAGRGQREVGGRVALEADAAVEVHLAVGHARGQAVEPDVARVEQDGAVHLLRASAAARRSRRRPFSIVARPENDRRIERAADLRRQLGAARAADVAIEALQDAEIRAARARDRRRGARSGRSCRSHRARCRRRRSACRRSGRRCCSSARGSASRCAARSRTCAPGADRTSRRRRAARGWPARR